MPSPALPRLPRPWGCKVVIQARPQRLVKSVPNDWSLGTLFFCLVVGALLTSDCSFADVQACDALLFS